MTRTLKLISAGAGVAAMLGLMGASSFATFTAQGSLNPTADVGSNGPVYNLNPSNTFDSGTLAITPGFAADSSWVINRTGQENMINLAINNLAPGDVVTRNITVSNTGTLPEYYTLTVGTTGSLFSNENRNSAGVVDPNPASVSVSLPISDNPSYPLLSHIWGFPGSGTSHYVLIAPGTTETLTVTVSLPLAAGNAFQDLRGDFTMTFNAEQAANVGTPDGAILNAVTTTP